MLTESTCAPTGTDDMTDAEHVRKLDELDRILNDPETPMDAARIWSLLAEITQHTGALSDTIGDRAAQSLQRGTEQTEPRSR